MLLVSDFRDKKPFCLSTANLAQAAASENWLVSMPLLRYLWVAMKRPKDGTNFSWQLNAAPDGCCSSSSQCWNFHLTELQTNPLPCLVPPQKKFSSFWLPAVQVESLATGLMENKQPLPQEQLFFTSFSSSSRFLNEPDVFHVHGKKYF